VTAVVGQSQATSIRARVKTGSELHLKNVSAQMIRIDRRIGKKKWKQFKLEQPIQLTWTDTDTILTDFPPSAAKYVNVFHVNHNNNKLIIWRLNPMPKALADFLAPKARYRVTVAVTGRQIQLEVDWRQNAMNMTVQLTKSTSRKVSRSK
jgi:hypothetical protein